MWTYALIMGAAITTGVALSRKTQSTLRLAVGDRWAIAVGAFCGAMIGAKLPFVLSDWEGLVSGAAWFSNGKTILCGLVGGYFGVVTTKWALHIQARTGDSFAVPVAASVAVGRLACFHAGCCYGTPTDLPWGVAFPAVDGLTRHPTQLYEAAFHAMAAAGLYLLWRRQIFPGHLFKLYVIAYAGYRFLTEMIRPEARLWLGLTGYQWASLLLIALFAGLWYRDRHAETATPAARFDVEPAQPAYRSAP